MSHVDTTIDLTPAQRAIVDRCDFVVTDEFGHVVVKDMLVTRMFGPAQGQREGSINDPAKGRVHGPVNTLDNMLEQLAYLHDLAVADHAKRAPSEEGTDAAHPGPSATSRTRTARQARSNRVATVAATAVVTGEAVTVAQVAAPQSGGVIGALVALLKDGTKRTRGELYDALAAQFPDRASAAGGMRTTISVQLGALRKKGHNIVSDADKRFWIE